MGLLQSFSRLGSWLGNHRVDAAHRGRTRPRICRFEEIENRRMMAADLIVGSVYYEQSSGDDLQPNLIQFTFQGGAPGTQLTRIVIDTDKDGQGISSGDPFFDTAPGGYGVFQSHPLQIVSHDGFQVLGTSVADGGSKLIIDLQGFDVGETLMISVDVDEFQFVSGDTKDINALVEGGEFQRSKFIATFQAPHYEDLTTQTLYWDFYDQNFTDAEQEAGQSLNLPPDRYFPQLDVSDMTAGAVAVAEQIPLPNSISGVVFLDHNLNNAQDPGDPGIAGVSLTLLVWNGTTYASTGLTTVTDTLGRYRFDDLEIGTFRVVETQPAGYESVGSKPGTVNGQTRGTVTTVDILSGINLLGGEDSIRNDFAEYLPVSISGRVHLNTQGDCDDPANPPIPNVKIELLNALGQVIDTTFTNAQGFYIFDNLKPGTYGVREIQPEGLFSAKTYVGTAGGTKGEDIVTDIVLTSGVDGLHYDFCELPPASISGFVYYDVNNNGVRDAGEAGIAGVTLMLKDANGNLTGATTTTDSTGFYKFAGLRPGTYGVGEVQPAGYLDGAESVGSAGGSVAMNDMIMGAVLTGGLNAVNYNFGELLPGSISGRVHLNTHGDCLHPENPPIKGVTIQLLNAQGQVIATTVTDDDGFYIFDDLAPGTYSVREIQPVGYFSAATFVGTAGGNKGDDIVTQISIGPGVDGLRYDFCELSPVSISGYVHVNINGDCDDPGNPPLPGVVIELLDAAGVVIATTVTDQNGFYIFAGLRPGTYGVHEVQPDGYLDGGEKAGSYGGVVTDDLVTEVVLPAGADAVQYNFCELLPPPPPEQPPEEPQLIFPPRPAPPEVPLAPPLFLPPPQYGFVIPPPEFLVPPILTRAGGQLYTWHLSIVDAGYPRGPLADSVVQLAAVRPDDEILWHEGAVDEVEWTIGEFDGDQLVTRKARFGKRGGLPVAGDFNGDGKFEVGLFYDGYWFLDLNDDGKWNAGDLWAKLGHKDDKPVTGDWNGDGKTDIGIYGPAWPGDPRAVAHEPGMPDPYNPNTAQHKNIPRPQEKNAVGHRRLKLTASGRPRSDLIDHVFFYGMPGDHPLVGDWNGDGIATIAVFRDGTWRRDADGDGRATQADKTDTYGAARDIPLAGDFNGDGIQELVIYRGGTWYVDTNGNGRIDSEDQTFELGGPNDTPVVGDFNGDGRTDPAVFHDNSATRRP